jgi:DNA-directed RNA polymerase subunit RPC12/RpoP
MPLHIHLHDEKLKCPYKGCGKSFEKPAVLTDSTSMPRETYYACPYCNSKLDIIVENMKLVGVRTTEYPKVFDSPAKCAHYFGFLTAIPRDAPIPDECLVCPKVLQCNIKKR